MKRYSPTLAFVLAAVVSMPCGAQEASLPAEAAAVDFCAEYFGCLDYGTLTEAEAQTARGHPLFVEAPRPLATLALQSSPAPERDLVATPVVSSQRH